MVTRLLDGLVGIRRGGIDVIIQHGEKIFVVEPVLIFAGHDGQFEGVVMRAGPSCDHALVGSQLGMRALPPSQNTLAEGSV